VAAFSFQPLDADAETGNFAGRGRHATKARISALCRQSAETRAGLAGNHIHLILKHLDPLSRRLSTASILILDRSVVDRLTEGRRRSV